MKYLTKTRIIGVIAFAMLGILASWALGKYGNGLNVPSLGSGGSTDTPVAEPEAESTADANANGMRVFRSPYGTGYMVR